jgi:ornithine carbamoyltransferase
MKNKHLLSVADLTTDQVAELLELSGRVKQEPEKYRKQLKGKSLALLFQKPSTRTRVSFQVGMHQLGGLAVVLGQNELQIGRGETIADTARVLSRYVDAIMARVFSQSILDELAAHGSVPVINGLSDLLHPCQALTDFFTIQENFGSLKGIRVAYVGDGNNVAHSLANTAAKVGAYLTIATPEGYAPQPKLIAAAREAGAKTGARITVTTDPVAAVKGVQVVYTDTWASMGQEAEHKARLAVFTGFQVNGELFAKADSDAIFLHCLPAHRGEEVTDDVADHSRSRIFDQAENRLHTQKAILLRILG